MNYYWVLEIMKTTKLRNIRDFFTAVKPFVRLFRPFFTDRNDRNGSGKSISHHHLLACSAWGLNRIRRIRSLWHLSGVLSRYFWLISGTRGWDLSRAGNLKALLDNVIVSRMSTLLPGTLSLSIWAYLTSVSVSVLLQKPTERSWSLGPCIRTPPIP